MIKMISNHLLKLNSQILIHEVIPKLVALVRIKFQKIKIKLGLLPKVHSLQIKKASKIKLNQRLKAKIRLKYSKRTLRVQLNLKIISLSLSLMLKN